MKSVLVRDIILKKMSKERTSVDDKFIKAYIMEAYYYICGKCEPSVLTKTTREDDQVLLRNTRNNAFLIVPDEPNFEDEQEHLMIDESLCYAVINYVCFLMSKGENVMYLKLCNEIINDYISNDGKELENAYL
ncbi:hypothetical protein A7X81_04740 [Campylobacter ornithocola]|uniref:Uncharacterized protein n=1 Tax=Campylobacter ornithocola TaxID=1848766 RepID=A0A6M8MRZ8_9BACT|nr:hypothetical protein [Campylobacter ornithocola]OCX42606.1 hypothetical protein A7X81_04740 [Campylobacter ornithocola]QKF57192.1 hypothetical protein CORN_0665 [Campylobacter ornithocola]